MRLPSHAINKASFPEMYETWLVAPLFAHLPKSPSMR